jgi:hypothetical protein
MGQAIADRWSNADKSSIGFWVNVFIIVFAALAPMIAAFPYGAIAIKLWLVTCCASLSGALKIFEKLIGGTPVVTDKDNPNQTNV